MVWTQEILPSPLSTVVSLFRSLIKSAPNMIQAVGVDEGCVVYGIEGNVSCAAQHSHRIYYVHNSRVDLHGPVLA